MPRRRSRKKDQGILSLLLDSPWYVSFIFVALIYSLLRWIIPSQIILNPYLVPLSKTIAGFAPYSLLFLIPGILSYFKQRKSSRVQRASAQKQDTILRNDPWGSPIEPTPGTESIPIAPTPIVNSINTTEWSLELLKAIEWKRFELLCAEYFRSLGKRVETLGQGADGGIDARVYAKDTTILEYAIQCKSWHNLVGVKAVRELFGVMAHESAGKGIFMTTSDFTNDALEFAKEHNDKLFLISGEKFITMLKKLPETSQKMLLDFATKGDFMMPTCPSCGIKLVKRSGKSGFFWGCKNYPKCRTTIKSS